MKSNSLAEDYLSRAEKRIVALEALLKVEAWADVVREAQEVVELATKAMMRKKHFEVPRIHDVSDILLEHKDKFEKSFHQQLVEICKISRELRRDRELAFYGSEDLSPSAFYKEVDADQAYNKACKVVLLIRENWSKF